MLVDVYALDIMVSANDEQFRGDMETVFAQYEDLLITDVIQRFNQKPLTAVTRIQEEDEVTGNVTTRFSVFSTLSGLAEGAD